MTNEYNIILTSKKAHAVETGIVLSQGDFGAVLKITVEGLDTSNTSCQIAFRKVAGSVEATGLTASGGVYSYALRGTELDQPGKVIADLKFREGTSKRISTASFIFEVAADTLDGLSEEAHSYSDSILQMRQQIVAEARADLAPVQYVQQSLTDAQKAQARANIGVASGLVYKGTVATTAQLPAAGNQPGDFYVVSANNHAYAWDGNAWRDNGAASGMQDYSGLVGDAWSSSKTYTVGDYAIYNNNLYKAKLQNSNVTPTNTTYWTHVSVANEVSLLNRDLLNLVKTTNIYTFDITGAMWRGQANGYYVSTEFLDIPSDCPAYGKKIIDIVTVDWTGIGTFGYYGYLNGTKFGLHCNTNSLTKLKCAFTYLDR